MAPFPFRTERLRCTHMRWRAIFGLVMAVLLSLTSVTTAMAHARSAGAIQLELCDAHGGTATITLDAAGNPISDPHHCPDCLAATPAPSGGPVAAPARPITRSERQVCTLTLPVEAASPPEALARGPPSQI